MAENKQFGGWYDNPATGTNMRWWGDWGWTTGEDPTGGAGPKPPPIPTTGVPTPSVPGTTPAAPTPQTGQPSSAQDLVNMGYYGYQGWGNAEAIANFQATGGAGKGGPTSGGTTTGGGGLPSFFTQPTIDLPKIYQNLYDTSGIKARQEELSEKERQFIEAKGKINDNPFLSEATRVGRVAKLEKLYTERTANLRGDIATAKADIETQLNLQTKQFDIQSQQVQNALTQFNALLQAGALDSATGEDIANITRATGMSSSMIQAAIAANKKKNVQTSTISFDDGKNQGFVVINSQTGEIISKQNVASSKPKEISTTSDTKNVKAQFSEDAKSMNFPDLVNKYANVMSLEEIYSAYLNSEMGRKWGKPQENAKEIRLLYQVAKGEKTPDQAREELEE